MKMPTDAEIAEVTRLAVRFPPNTRIVNQIHDYVDVEVPHEALSKAYYAAKHLHQRNTDLHEAFGATLASEKDPYTLAAAVLYDVGYADVTPFMIEFTKNAFMHAKLTDGLPSEEETP